MNVGIIHKLTTAIDADMVLLATSVAILANMVGLAIGTFHQSEDDNITSQDAIHPLLMQRHAILSWIEDSDYRLTGIEIKRI